MSAGPDPRTANAQVIEQERRRLSQRLDEVARLCESGIAPPAFYAELLQRLIESLAAVAGAVWLRTAQGNLQQQFQINLQQVGLDAGEEVRACHDMLLRAAFTHPQPLHLPPRSTMGEREDGKPVPGNLTAHLLLLVPILHNEQVVGLIEIFQGANRPASAVPGFLQYMTLMADLAGRFQRNQLVGQLVGQQQLWTQLEGFARNIHATLSPTEVSFIVANEGRRLIECDRVCVAIRRGGERTAIEAVSGTDVVEKRSNQVKLMRSLADAVIHWGERLTFAGTKDDSLPPRVLDALDAYLAESPSKLLVVLPLHDEREGDGKDKPKQTPRSALIMECFESPLDQQQVLARLDVVSRHATSALYNAIEHRRIPLRFLWLPIAKLQEGLGGKTRAIVTAVVVLLSLIGAGLYALPYPLKVDSTGQVLPQVRRTIFPPVGGKLEDFHVQPNEEVGERRELARMYDVTLAQKLLELEQQMKAAAIAANEYETRRSQESAGTEKINAETQAALKRAEQHSKAREIDELIERNNAVRNRPGWFKLLAPPLTSDERQLVERSSWTVLTSNFQEMKDREVKPNEAIMRLGVKEGPWEVEMRIPQKHIGQVRRAFENNGGKPLDVDFLLLTNTTTVYQGKLERHRIASEATANRDENTGESEPYVLAYVRIEGEDIEPGYRVSRNELVSGTEVRAKVRCGLHRAGYSLFYGVWEFFYEKVVFFF